MVPSTCTLSDSSPSSSSSKMKEHMCPASIRWFLTKRGHPPRSLSSPWTIEKLSLLRTGLCLQKLWSQTHRYPDERICIAYWTVLRMPTKQYQRRHRQSAPGHVLACLGVAHNDTTYHLSLDNIRLLHGANVCWNARATGTWQTKCSFFLLRRKSCAVTIP